MNQYKTLAAYTKHTVTTDITYEYSEHKNRFDPNVWGPSFWFSLHNGSLKYPKEATKIVSERMKGFILGLPYILPCEDCSEHARAFIDMNVHNLDNICSSSENLFAFFVSFHNAVNKRYNKPTMSIAEAKQLYAGDKVIRIYYK